MNTAESKTESKSRPSLRVLRKTLLFLFIIAAVIGSRISMISRRPARSASTPAESATLRDLQFYTNPSATTPQIPFWAALPLLGLEKEALETVYWKTSGQLQTLLLAGKGDIWIGPIEGFSRARSRGAPVVLLAVTGWRKMSIVSCDPDVTSSDDIWGKPLPYAPFGSPGAPTLKAMTPSNRQPPVFEPHEPKQLAAEIAKGKIRTALLPEPLVTIMLKKNPDLKIVTTLEEMRSKITGGPARIPWAGIAVHENLLKTHSKSLKALVAAMKRAARDLADNPERAAATLPDAFAQFIPKEIVTSSLQRDLMLVENASDVMQEIEDYLRLVAPEVIGVNGDIPILKSGFLNGDTPEK